MTDTRTFKTIATKRNTGETRVFFAIHSKLHHAAAVKWLRS